LREQRGERRGELNALRLLVTRQLAKKFSPLSGSVISKLETLSVQRLDEIAMNLIDAKSLEELGLGDA